MKESKRKAVATAETIRKALTKNSEESKDQLDMTKMAKSLADRREKVMKEDNAE